MSSEVLFLREGEVALDSLCFARFVVEGERNDFLLEELDSLPKKKFAMLVRFVVGYVLVGEMGERCGGMGDSPTPPAASKLMYDETGGRLVLPGRR
jgi:hypothetical protein